MPSIPRTSRRRKMMVFASARRRIQKLGPYQSMALLLVPVTLVEPLKFIALFVAGEGHWLTGTGMILGAYAVSILVVERLFRVQAKANDAELVRQIVDAVRCCPQQNQPVVTRSRRVQQDWLISSASSDKVFSSVASPVQLSARPGVL
jgi:hypothetical protein